MKSSSFQFSNPRQSEIYSSLKRFVGEAPASFYRDACKIMNDDCDLETKTHLIGHLMREIFGWIIDIMIPIDYELSTEEKKESDKAKDGYKRKIKHAASIYGISETDKTLQFWLDRVAGNDNGLQSWAHKESMESVRPTNKEFEDLWNGTELLLYFLLDKIEGNYLIYTKQLDTILAKEKISNRDIEKIKKHIPLNHITMDYFFDKLEHLECLSLLNKNNFFKYPQKPFEHENGGTSYPHWPQMAYLIKMSKIPSKQDEVLEICLNIETTNINTQVQILEVALNLSPEKSVKIIDKSYNWFNEINSWFHPEKYGKLMMRLVSGGLKNETLKLARKILKINPDPRNPVKINGESVYIHDPIALFDDWHYEKIIQENYPTLVDEIGTEAIDVLIDLVEDYINLSSSNGETPKDDLSYIWRPAIEDHEQNHNSGIKDILISGLRDSCERYLKKYPEQILTMVNKLGVKKLVILDRISLHILRNFPKGAEEKIVDTLMDVEEFKSERLTHEYFLLAESHSSMLNSKQKNTLWSWIVSGADIDEFKKWRQDNGQQFTKELGERYQRSWQMYHLMPFHKIDPKWEEYYKKLVKEFGEPKYPTFRSWSEGGSWGPTSELSSDQLKEMDPSDVVDFLQKWQPSKNDPLDHSREGTGRQLTDEISTSPHKWVSVARSFLSLDATYVRAYLSGFREALKQGGKFDWKPILEISREILKKPIEITNRESATVPFGDDPDWSWCRSTVIDLVEEGLLDHEGKIPSEYRKHVWEIIEILTKDPDPTPVREEEYLKTSKDDPQSLAINSIRGDAISTAIRYGIWLKNSLNKTEQERWRLSKDAPELLKVLNDHLDIKVDSSLAIRSVYGEKLGNLTWLDQEWVTNKHHLVFPAESKLQKYFDASWEAYIVFVNAHNNLFKIIKEEYKRAVSEIGKRTEKKHHLENPDQRLAHHLTIFYWRDLIELNEGLLADFYKIANVDLKAEIIEFIGRTTKQDKDIPKEVASKLVALLEERIKQVKEFKDDTKEFQSLSWWLASEKFDDKWILDKLHEVLEMGCSLEGEHLVIDKFISLVNKFPLEVVRCLKLMIENDKKEWGIIYLDGNLRTILANALKSQEKDAVKAATELIHRLAARGHLEYKDLV